MANLKKYNLAGQEIGSVAIEEDLLKADANTQMIKDYLIALRANARQWSANTKGRSEVSHSGQKPHPQKGTGRARQGCLAAPQYKGGGRVFAPKPKSDQHVRINKKERRAAIKHLIVEKIQSNCLHVLKDEAMNEPKTKKVADFLKKCVLEGKRVLFLGQGAIQGQSHPDVEVSAPVAKYATFVRSMRNIPKAVFLLMPNISGYDITLSQEIVILESALDELRMLLGGGK
ncbi:MAG: 50S ribosomal protein L4 [Anaerolineae bacterium]